MKRLLFAIAPLLLLATSPSIAESPARFMSVDVIIESVDPVAAWQFEFSSTAGVAQVVGVENGDSDAFGDAPYYDREAVEQGRADRIVVADYSLEKESMLPRGRFRITTLHLMLSGDGTPEFDTRLVVATTPEGKRINPEISIEVSGRSKP